MITGKPQMHPAWMVTVPLLFAWPSPRPAIAQMPAAREAQTAARDARLRVTPVRVAPGFPVHVVITGLPPGAAATVHAQSVVTDDSGHLQPYYADATFLGNRGRTVSGDTAAPVTGYYRGADPRGLFWSARPTARDSAARTANAALHLGAGDHLTPGQVRLTLTVQGFIRDRAIVTFARADSGLLRQDVHTGGFVGAFYFERGARRRPVVLVLGGSEGGLDVADWIGPKLVARGFAVLGVEYVSPRGAPVRGVAATVNRIPIELLDSARAWLSNRPEVAIDRLGVVGYSKGAEFALVLASIDSWIKAVVAYAPSDFVWQGIRTGESGTASSSWTRRGRELSFIPTKGTREAIVRGRRDGTPIYLARVVRSSLAAASPAELHAARIPVEHSHAALLLIGGGDDQLWDSGASVMRLAARLRQARYAYPLQTLVYTGAGHVLVGTGWQPTTTDNTDQFRNGGSARNDAYAQGDSWPRVLAFLSLRLGQSGRLGDQPMR